MEIIGWIGTICLSLFAAPAALKVFEEKHAYTLSGAFMALGYMGQWLTLIYLLVGTKNVSLPLLANYTANIALLSVIVYYKLYPKVQSFKSEVIVK